MALSKITNTGIDNITVDSSGNVGIGTSTNTTHSLFIHDSDYQQLGLSGTRPTIFLKETDGNADENYQIRLSDGDLQFQTQNDAQTNAVSRLVLDSSGNLLVGTTDGLPADNAVEGFVYKNGLSMQVHRDAGPAAGFGRGTSDGAIVNFFKDGSTVGSVGTSGGGAFYITDAVYGGLGFSTVSGQKITPCTTAGALLDNVLDLGYNTARFDDIFATNGTIQTSDANEKQQIAALTDAEITAAKAISQLFKTFKWNSAVTEKGDAARTHAGVIAQDVQAAMTAAGLDAGDYAFFISSTWWETQTEVPAVEADEENGVEAQEAYTRTDIYDTAEEAPEGAVERTRLGIRYPELLAFVGAATEQRLANIETRLTALENA